MSEQNSNDQALDQQEGEHEELQESGAESTDQGSDQSDQSGGDESGDSDTQEGEADAGAGSESESSHDEVGDESADRHPDQDSDPEAEQLAAALAAATASSQQPAVPVNDAIPDAPVSALAAVVAAAAVSDIPAEAPVAAPAARAPSVTTSKPVPLKVDVKAQQADLKLQLIVDRLQQYAEAMAPNKVLTVAIGKAQQLSLWTAIQQTLKLEGAEFIRAYGVLLDFFAEHRTTIFNDKYIYRNFAEAAISANEKKIFNRMLHLLVATCDKATRRLGLEQVDLEKTLADIRDTGIQQRVAEFYQI
jgi:hypothetical protein